MCRIMAKATTIFRSSFSDKAVLPTAIPEMKPQSQNLRLSLENSHTCRFEAATAINGRFKRARKKVLTIRQGMDQKAHQCTAANLLLLLQQKTVSQARHIADCIEEKPKSYTNPDFKTLVDKLNKHVVTLYDNKKKDPYIKSLYNFII